MRKLLLGAMCGSMFLFGFTPPPETQTKQDNSAPQESPNKPKVLAVNTNELEAGA